MESVDSNMYKRIIQNQSIGTVLYSGPLTHEGAPAGSDTQKWLGIEWDDITRGRHNGTVKDVKYFQTSRENAGTLIKEEKVEFGQSLVEGVFKKYFRDGIPEDSKRAILEKLESQVWKDEVNEKKPEQDQKQDEKELVKVQELEKVKEVQKDEEFKADQDNKEGGKVKKILVEYDENVYFETFRKEKKMVEFYGFDKIWEKLNNMKELKEISLCGVQISNLGDIGYLKKLLPNISVFSIESNLLYDWNQVFQIGNELDTLEELSISNNYFKPIDCKIDEFKSIKYMSSGKEVQVPPKGIFKKLKILNIINTKMNWKLFSLIANLFPILEELILCKNDMTDTENINLDNGVLQNLTFLNLEMTQLTSFEGFKEFFGNLPKLDKIILNFNQLTKLGKIENFKAVKSVSLEGNQISDPKILTELSQFPNLYYLNIKKNPVSDIYGKPYVRQRAVAENPNLFIVNGSDLQKYERKDCEIFYLRRIFEDYFKKFDKVYYDYDFQEFLDYAIPENPRLDYLLKKYGNPFEIKPKQENNMESESIAKNVMVKLQIVIAAGPMTAKTMNKRFPDNTTISTLKNIFQNLFKIPADQQIITYKVNPEDQDQKFEEDHKPLNFYGIKDNTEVVVDQKGE